MFLNLQYFISIYLKFGYGKKVKIKRFDQLSIGCFIVDILLYTRDHCIISLVFSLLYFGKMS